jgi:phosphocarrier protein HPr
MPFNMAAAIMDSSTASREVVVGLEEGLHLTPLRALTLLAEKFSCEISIHKGDRMVDAKSMLDLMTLMAEHGTRLQLSAQGPDAPAAIQALGELFDNNFRPADQC